jgi:hypothetical protein
MSGWELPCSVTVGGRAYAVCSDYRDVLEVIAGLNDAGIPEQMRYRVALELFYEDGYSSIAPEERLEAAEQMMWFINCGETETDTTPRPKLIDWEQDQLLIVADINKTAGMEIRALPYLHWWTFLSYFSAIGEGRLSAVVAIREKLRTGKKLDELERKFYRENPSMIVLKNRYTQSEEELLSEWLGKR